MRGPNLPLDLPGRPSTRPARLSPCSRISGLVEAHRAGRALALFFDYDGTLTPIVDHPDRAHLSPLARELLRRLAGQPRVTVGVLSGRALADVKAKVGLPGLYYAGTCGLELDLRGVVVTHPGAETGRPLLEGLARRLRDLADDYPGAWVEEKRYGLTLHYRRVAPHLAPDFRSRAVRTLQRCAQHLRLLDGPRAVEVALAVGWTKGTALRRLTTHAGTGAVPLYAGDEANDADALEAAADLRGVALGIGPRAPATARQHLPDPAALHALLARLLHLLERP
jgi:trehalose-phosphatase